MKQVDAARGSSEPPPLSWKGADVAHPEPPWAQWVLEGEATNYPSLVILALVTFERGKVVLTVINFEQKSEICNRAVKDG